MTKSLSQTRTPLANKLKKDMFKQCKNRLFLLCELKSDNNNNKIYHRPLKKMYKPIYK